MIMDLIIKNAEELITISDFKGRPKIRGEMQDLGIIRNGGVVIKDGRIITFGPSVFTERFEAKEVLDAKGKVVLPGFIDCHTHLVFAGSREKEFNQKVNGLAYLEILERGGGIFNTVEKTRKASAVELIAGTLKKIKMASDYGTTTMEAKSGYGLEFLSELATLKIVKSLRCHELMDLVPTFLGAHAVPPEFKGNKKGYIQDVLGMLEKIQGEDLAEYCDVFVEKGAFNLKEAKKVLTKAKELGFKIKLHAGEFNDIGGAELGAEIGAVSIDHLDYISEKGIRLMAEKGIIGVLLPGVPFHLMSKHYAPARKLIEAGVPVALATDFNPGSCPTLSMQMIIALACRQMKLTPAEAINAATLNAAYAIGRADEIGSIKAGKKADIIVLNIPDHQQLPYWFGMNLAERVIKNGKIVK